MPTTPPVPELPSDRIVKSADLRKELADSPQQNFFKVGYGYLDQLIGGFAEGDLIILGGTPKAGKTTLLQSWTKKFAAQNIGCLWFSVELSNREFLSRFGDDMPIFWLPRVMPMQTTHTWIENKIIEAKKEHDVKMVFVDHLGMIMDEATARERNSVDILDARLFRLKRFAIQQKVAMIVVAPFVGESLRKKKTEPSTGDFRGTAMLGYTADTLLGLDRSQGSNKVQTINEEYEDARQLADGFQISSDAYLYVLDSRRTGVRKVRIKMALDDHGNYIEA